MKMMPCMSEQFREYEFQNNREAEARVQLQEESLIASGHGLRAMADAKGQTTGPQQELSAAIVPDTCWKDERKRLAGEMPIQLEAPSDRSRVPCRPHREERISSSYLQWLLFRTHALRAKGAPQKEKQQRSLKLSLGLKQQDLDRGRSRSFER